MVASGGRAARARRARRVSRDEQFGPFHGPRIEHLQPSRQRRADAGDELESLGRLHAADDADQRREDAHRRARDVLEAGVVRKRAGVAGRRGAARVVDGDLAVEADRRPGDQGLAMADAGDIDGVPGREVVAAVDDDDCIGDQPAELVCADALVERRDVDARVEGGDRERRGHRLWRAHAREIVRDLPLQVGEVDAVAVDERDAADAGAAKIERDRRAEPAGADDEHTGREQPALAVDADVVEQDVARVAQQGVVVHRRSAPGNENARAGHGRFAAQSRLGQLVWVSGLRSTAVLLASTVLPLKRFSAWASWKSSGLPNSGGGFSTSALAWSASNFLRASSRAFSRASSLTSAPWPLCRCLSRSASRVRRAANRLPSAVSSSMTSGTIPLAWIEAPLGV